MASAALQRWAAIQPHVINASVILGIVGSAFWFVAKPQAEKFVTDTVTNSRAFATTNQLNSVDTTVQSIKQQMDELLRKIDDTDRSRAQVQQDLRDLKTLQIDMNRILLQRLQ